MKPLRSWTGRLLVVLFVPVAALTACSSSPTRAAAPPATGPAGTTSTTLAATSSAPTTATSPATTAATAASSTGSCLTGNWQVVSPSAYAGSSWSIHADGSITVLYTGLLSGPASFKTTLPADPTGSSGSYVATPVSQNVTSEGRTVTLSAHNTTWHCQGDSLTLDVSPGASFTFTRRS